MSYSNVDFRAVQGSIQGYVIGPIWDGRVCSMPFTLNLYRNRRAPDGTKLPLAQMVCRALKAQGDFQVCQLAKNSFVRLSFTRQRGRTVITTEKQIPVSCFRSLRPYVSRKAARPSY